MLGLHKSFSIITENRILPSTALAPSFLINISSLSIHATAIISWCGAVVQLPAQWCSCCCSSCRFLVFVIARRWWSSAPRLSDYKIGDLLQQILCTSLMVLQQLIIYTRSYSRVRSSKFKIVIFASHEWVNKFVVLAS